MNFCPQCGSPLHQRLVKGDSKPRLVCQSCGFIFYVNPKIVVGAIAIQDGKAVMLRRRIEPRVGFWTYPAGYMEAGETVEGAARREAWEEIGMEVQIERPLGVYSRADSPFVSIVFVARAFGRPHPGDEALEVRLFSPAEIPWDHLAFWSTIGPMRDWAKSAAV